VVRFPSRVVTTTFETFGLSRNTRVSVFVPLLSVDVVISELSAAGCVVATVLLAFSFVFAFDCEAF
jgi:hypothetical protein